MTDPSSHTDRKVRNAHWLSLVLRARADAQAFDQLYMAAAPWLLRMARRLVGAEDAEDVLAETFLQAWRELARFDPQRACVPVWLSVIAHSRAVDHLRRRRSPPFDDPMELMTGASVPQQDPATLVARVQELRLLDVQIQAQLSASERDVLALAYFEELSQSEIAERQGMPLGTVKTRMNRALHKLRLAMACGGAAAWPVPVTGTAQAVKGAGHA